MRLCQTISIFAFAICASAGTYSVASARPMPLLNIEGQEAVQVRVVCDEYGRCFQAGPRHRYRGNRCPDGYTVQQGACRPYLGGTAGHRTWNGCPPNFTIQDGQCKPYRGPYRY
jgi:hypothetical protein